MAFPKHQPFVTLSSLLQLAQYPHPGRQRENWGDPDTALETTEGKYTQFLGCTSLAHPQGHRGAAAQAAARAKPGTQKTSQLPDTCTGGAPSPKSGLLFLIYVPLKVTPGVVRGDFSFVCPVL